MKVKIEKYAKKNNTTYKSLNNIENIILQHRHESDYDVTDLSLKNIPDIYGLKNLKEGAELVYKHILNNSKICLVTDYDADGVTSAAVLYRALRDFFNYDMKNNVVVFINERAYGNGVNNTLANFIIDYNRAYDKPIDLIITADHGSADEERYKRIKEKTNIDICVTDHHEVPNGTPPKSPDVFINPKQPGDTYSKDISGCTVAYYLMSAVYLEKEKSDIQLQPLKQLMSFVALTVITDFMPLDSYINKILFKNGLEEINNKTLYQWQVFRDGNKYKKYKPFNELEMGMYIGPIINSCGRMGNANLGFLFLTSNNEKDTFDLLTTMQRLNQQRRRLEKDLTYIAEDQYKKQASENSIVIYLDKGYGVAGIIAAKLGNKYNKPTFVLSKSKDSYKGSGRAIIDKVNLIESLNNVNKDKDVLIKYGGHTGACGCDLREDKTSEFFTKFNTEINKQLENIDTTKTFYIDAELTEEQLKPELLDSINKLGPYGHKWPRPLFKSRLPLLRVSKPSDYHNVLQLVLNSHSNEIKAVMFDAKHLYRELINYIGSYVNIVFYIDVEYINETKKQLKLEIVNISNAF